MPDDPLQAVRIAVEVSGWDHQEEFFVEQTVIEWRPPEARVVYMRRALPDGGVVFVRLLETEPDAASSPVVYRVQAAGRPDPNGMRAVVVEPAATDDAPKRRGEWSR